MTARFAAQNKLKCIKIHENIIPKVRGLKGERVCLSASSREPESKINFAFFQCFFTAWVVLIHSCEAARCKKKKNTEKRQKLCKKTEAAWRVSDIFCSELWI